MTDANKNHFRWWENRGLPVLLAAIAVVFGAAPSVADAPKPKPAAAAVAPDWCALDDPASYLKQVRALRVTGSSDKSSLTCPAVKTADGGAPAVLALPMPCGRHMVFQRIDVPARHMLDQVVGHFGRQVDVTAETPQIALSTGGWQAPVAGGFTISDSHPDTTTDAIRKPSTRAYYMARYEVTRPQILLWRMGLMTSKGPGASATDAACKPYLQKIKGTRHGFVGAASDLNWFDAVDFARAYTNWLLARDSVRVEQGQKPWLPWEQGAPGIVRLPSEAEWEYAARGGASSVNAEARSLTLPKMRDPETGHVRPAKIEEICADQPRRGRGGSPRNAVYAVGRKAPNLLGLYDVVCGVDEVVMDPFRLTRPDGLHGQVGGYVARGGNSLVGRERNTVSLRVEKEFYRLKGEHRTYSSGVRLAIGAMSFPGRRDPSDKFHTGKQNTPLNTALMSARKQLTTATAGENRQQRQQIDRDVNDLRQKLDRQEIDKKDLVRRVFSLQQQIETLNTSLNDQARDKARQLTRTGVVSGHLIARLGRFLYTALLERAHVLEDKNSSAEDRELLAFKNYMPHIAKMETRIQAAFDLYLAVQIELSRENRDFVQAQLRTAQQQLGQNNFIVYEKDLKKFIRHQQEMRQSGGRVTEGMRRRWLLELDDKRAERDTEFPEFK